MHVSPPRIPGSSLWVRSPADRLAPRGDQQRLALAARREVAHIRWRLILPGRREKAIIDRIDLIAQGHILVVLGAQVLGPFRVAIAPVASRHGPWTGQRMVGGRDLVMEKIGIGLIEIDALLDDSLVI